VQQSGQSWEGKDLKNINVWLKQESYKQSIKIVLKPTNRVTKNIL